MNGKYFLFYIYICKKRHDDLAGGKFYSGEYLNDQKHGTGVFQLSDGRRYEGKWAHGK